MNAPLRTVQFDAAPRPLARPEHLRAARKSTAERLTGAAITIAAHVAAVIALVVGFHAVRAPAPPAPIMVSVEMKRDKPKELAVVLPKFTPPAEMSVPAPVFDFAPSPHAITAPPPAAAAPPAQPSAPQAGNDTGAGRASYLGMLLAQFNRFKHYPPEARAARIEGVVMVHFVLAHDGRLVSAEIAKSSGRPALDREALALMSRAQPLPPMPVEMGDNLTRWCRSSFRCVSRASG